VVIILGARIIMSESGGRGESNDPTNCWTGPKWFDRPVVYFAAFVAFT